MFGPTNPQNEELRAQRTLNALTDQNQAVEVFERRQVEQRYLEVEAVEPTGAVNRSEDQSGARLFNAIKLYQQRLADEAV